MSEPLNAGVFSQWCRTCQNGAATHLGILKSSIQCNLVFPAIFFSGYTIFCWNIQLTRFYGKKPGTTKCRSHKLDYFKIVMDRQTFTIWKNNMVGHTNISRGNICNNSQNSVFVIQSLKNGTTKCRYDFCKGRNVDDNISQLQIFLWYKVICPLTTNMWYIPFVLHAYLINYSRFFIPAFSGPILLYSTDTAFLLH